MVIFSVKTSKDIMTVFLWAASYHDHLVALDIFSLGLIVIISSSTFCLLSCWWSMWLKSHITVWLTLCFPWCITRKKMKKSQILSNCQNFSYTSEINQLCHSRISWRGNTAVHNPYMMHALVTTFWHRWLRSWYAT